ncbi:MAG: hypothetical protein WBN07_05185 [Woeseiaceae bacterium]
MSNATAEGRIEMLMRSNERDLGEFTVPRVLSAAERRMVGPFVVVDHMGAAKSPPGKGIAVRPHPPKDFSRAQQGEEYLSCSET